ncbi:MAG: hypothetical protein ABIR10_11845 [Dokdonella sp.]
MKSVVLCMLLACPTLAFAQVNAPTTSVFTRADGLSTTANAPPVTTDGDTGFTDPVSVDDAASRRTISEIPGESIDPRTGSLSLTMTDLVVPGNGGMDLVISRTRRGTFFRSLGATQAADYSYQEGMADWRLDVPFIQVAALGGWDYTVFSNGGVCGYPYPPDTYQPNSDADYYQQNFRGVAIVGIPGTGPKELLLRNLEPDGYLNSKYATPDRWLADCGGSQYSTIPEHPFISQFVVHAPNGSTYYFDEPTHGNNLMGDGIFTFGYLEYMRVFVSKIVDRNGNWTRYEYDNSKFSANVQQHPEMRDFAYVKRISTSDLREVTFEWETNPFCMFPQRTTPQLGCAPEVSSDYFDGSGFNGAPFQRLKSFTSSGRTWQYKYNDTAAAPDTARYLKQVVLPNGQSWNYDVTAGQGTTWNPCSYPYTMQVSDYQVGFPDGGIVNYTMSWRWFFRQNFQENGGPVFDLSHAFSCWPVSAVQKRTVNNLVNATPMVTQWCYDPVPKKTRDGNYVLWTYMLAPGHTEVFKFVRELTNGDRWQEGALVESQIRAPMAACPASIGDPGSGYLRKTTYDYVAGPRISNPTLAGHPEIIVHPEIPAYPWSISTPRALSRRVIDQPDTGTFELAMSNFDQYFMPKSMSEKSADGTTRLWVSSYDQRVSRNATTGEVKLLLGLVSSHCLVAKETDTACPKSLTSQITQGDVSSFDTAGNMTSTTSYGKTKGFAYYPTGDVHTTTDERFNTTTYGSDYMRGIPRTVTLPGGDGAQVSAEINDTGTIKSVTNARSNRTAYEYDVRDRLQTVTPPIGFATAIGWSGDGRTKTLTRGSSQSVEKFDGFGRLVEEDTTDTGGNQTVIKARQYDTSGHLVFESYPSATADAANSNGFHYDYDALGRRYKTTRTVDQAYTQTTFGTARAKETQVVRDFNGATTTSVSRSFGAPNYEQLLSISTPVTGNDAAGNPTPATVLTSFQRDLLGFATTVTQGAVTRRYALDDKRLLTLEYVPELGTPVGGYTTQSASSVTPLTGNYNVSYCRDDAGHLLGKAIGYVCSLNGSGSGSLSMASTQTPSASCTTPSGAASLDSASPGCGMPPQVYTTSYDARDRLSTVTYTDGVTPNISPIVYTATDKVKTLTKGGVAIEMDYDSAENLSYEIFKLDGYKFRLRYAYDDLNHLKSIQYPSGKSYQLSPDAFGRPHGLTGTVSSASYYPTGMTQSIQYVNGEVTSITPTPQNFVETIITQGPHGSAVSLDYGYDNNGNPQTIVDGLRPNDTMTVAYDQLNRQIKTQYPNGFPGVSYRRGYDQTGNVLFDQTPEKAVTMGYDASANRLLNIANAGATQALSYDGYGNMVADGVRALTFDSARDLRSSQAPAQKTFAYDGRDRLVSRIDAQGTRYFVYSGEKLMMEYAPTENKYTEYLYFRGQLAGSRVVTLASQVDSDGDGVKDVDEFHGLGW